MKLSRVHKLMLFSLGQFYQSINQPLVEKPVRLRTSKIAFIELLLSSKTMAKQTRAVYKNLEFLEKKKLIAYQNKLIKFTEKGINELKRVDNEIRQFVEIKKHFKNVERPKRKWQTVIRD